jgi:glycosyltransferase involved in cell wall biosynthesis
MKHAKKPKVCIVIPSYNEEACIGEVIDAINTTFEASPLLHTIVCVDDGSKDTTATIAKAHGAVVVCHILNSGAGAATATGLSYAQQYGYDIAVTMDADGQHDPKDALRGVTQLIKSEDDLLIGSRLIDSKGMSTVKIIGNKGLGVITFLLFGVNSTDSQSGLRIFSRKALEQLQWKTRGYEFCSEMLWRAHQLRLKIGEYPIKAIYTDYSQNKGQNNWNGVNIVKSLVKQRIMELF